ncbi:MAG: hypothetical protein ACNYPE_10330 [Candidatus Azotimanducaceae bacterium WSBS_2022_MAG_OTU7]
MTDGKRHRKRRLTALLVVIPLLAGGLVFLTISQFQARLVEVEQSRFGQSSARQLAAQVAGYIVEDNLLSLNVIVAQLTRDEPLQFVAIYDESNQLIAQSGKEERTNTSYTAEVTFQDSLVGRVRVTVSHAETNLQWLGWVLFVIAMVYSVLVWRFTTPIINWINHDTGAGSIESQGADAPLQADDGPTEECILVVRIRPAQRLDQHFDKFFKAANLYGGIVEQTTPEELVIHFDSPDAMYIATCSGLLIQKIAAKVNSKIAFGGTLDLLNEDPEKTRKAASYLASIAEGNLIAAHGFSLLSERVELQPFHHALVDSKSLLRIAGLNNPDLLNYQASQLAAAG